MVGRRTRYRIFWLQIISPQTDRQLLTCCKLFTANSKWITANCEQVAENCKLIVANCNSIPANCELITAKMISCCAVK